LQRTEILPRKKPVEDPETFLPYKAEPDGTSNMPSFGDGYKLHITGLTHDERGYPDASNPKSHSTLVKRLCKKILANTNEISTVKTMFTEDADILIVSYGAPSRSVITAVKRARKKGLKVGFIKLETVWPFPEDMLLDAAKDAQRVIVVEMNLGQIFHEVQRVLKSHDVELLPKIGGEMHKPEEILERIEKGKE